MRKSSRLILALDETDEKKALAIAESVSGIVDAIKINWPLVLSAGPEMITKLSKYSDVICDFKVADIPNTVRLIVENSVARGAAAVIVHAFPGSDSLAEAVKAAGDKAFRHDTALEINGGSVSGTCYDGKVRSVKIAK
jgi:orotidine-5'-phosphate decarboxylase